MYYNDIFHWNWAGNGLKYMHFIISTRTMKHVVSKHEQERLERVELWQCEDDAKEMMMRCEMTTMAASFC